MVGDLLLSGLGKDRGLARCRACAAGVKGTAMQAYSCASVCWAHGACKVAVEASAHCEGWPRPISSINQQRMTLFTTPRSRTGAPGPRVRRYKRHHAAQVRWQVPSRPEKCCYVSGGGWQWGSVVVISRRRSAAHLWAAANKPRGATTCGVSERRTLRLYSCTRTVSYRRDHPPRRRAPLRRRRRSTIKGPSPADAHLRNKSWHRAHAASAARASATRLAGRRRTRSPPGSAAAQRSTSTAGL